MSTNLGELSDQIFAKDAEIKTAASKVKDLEVEKRALEETLHSLMDQAGTTLIRGQTSQTKLETKIRVNFADFEAFERFCLRKKALHLFERRISSTAYREMKESLGGKPIPGLSEFPQVRVNTTRA